MLTAVAAAAAASAGTINVFVRSDTVLTSARNRKRLFHLKPPGRCLEDRTSGSCVPSSIVRSLALPPDVALLEALNEGARSDLRFSDATVCINICPLFGVAAPHAKLSHAGNVAQI